MNRFLAKPSILEVVRAAFVTCLIINFPTWLYAWYFEFKEGPLAGMPMQPFDGACDMALLTGLLLLLLIGCLERKEKLLRWLGVFQILASLSVTTIPKF